MKASWFKQAVIYQLHIKAFFDSNGDGIGDFNGLLKKMDYLESLGITAVWLLPFFPSPMKDDGYDISDYLNVQSMYGSLQDFRKFLKAAHERNIKVITELVINHTSDQHPWFQRARRAKKGSAFRNFYVWSDQADKYLDARVIFEDFEKSNWAWDPIAKAYYWHRFYSNQPDLNFENTLVQKEILRAMNFWFDLGVDGLRLDAVPYLFEAEGTNCENLEATHQFLKKLRAHTDRHYADRILIAEANQWPEDAIAYFGQGDECHMAFHFPLMPRLFMAIHMEDRFPIMDILEQTPPLPPLCQWAMFIRNHDELTLEMVSDEERDYMYRVYAKDPKARINLGIRRRLAPLMDNDRSKIELMNILLFSLPGTPVIYYGDEIGMGDNFYLGDRNGVRTPMQWNANVNAGFSAANPQKLYLPLIIDPQYNYEMVNVENQEQNPSSLLSWIKKIIAIRKSYAAFGSGALEFVHSNNYKVLAFTRTIDEEIILVVTNLSRFPQAAELDLTKFTDYIPIELFHHNVFPPIRQEMYPFTLGPYGYFWLRLSLSAIDKIYSEEGVPNIIAGKRLDSIFDEPYRSELTKKIFPRFLKNMRWFGHKTAKIHSVEIMDLFPVENSYLCFLSVRFLEQEFNETYCLPLSFASGLEAEKVIHEAPHCIIASIQYANFPMIIFDGILQDSLRKKLFRTILNQRKIKFGLNKLAGNASPDLDRKHAKSALVLPSVIVKGEQSNTSIIYDQKYFLKLYRKLEEGVHPDKEMEKFLTEKAHFPHVPQFGGSLDWHRPDHTPTCVAILETVVSNQGTGWSLSLEALSDFYEQIMANNMIVNGINGIETLIGGNYKEAIRLLGQRTAELHLALSSSYDEPNFAPEPFSLLYQRSIYQGMRSRTRKVFQTLWRIKNLPEKSHGLIEAVIKREEDILDLYYLCMKNKFRMFKIRIHGDYHLGQVLYTGKDFYIVDFEGEPLASLSARRLKKSALRDVAGMLRSFHYAAHASLQVDLIPEDYKILLEPWADAWYKYIVDIFLKSYVQTASQCPIPLFPQSPLLFQSLLQAYLIDKAIYELNYELNMRPDWASIPCRGILYHLNSI
ncbi:MAG: maltose alpha-D-glucosyltransferase [Candidatus Protochlamydia sp.]|nr:maltose alpha-D-glucosyltransferase [Candidatus Protochlamydia sp.]